MSLFKKLFGKREKDKSDEQNELPWIDGTENKWGIRLLDLRPFTQHMLSTSSDPQMAHNAVSYSQEDGTTFFGRKPQNNGLIDTDLNYTVDKVLEAGVLFTPNTMEHKWAIFFDGEYLIFVRSWLREVFAIARTETANNRLAIKNIQGSFTQEESPAFTIAILNYLLISHVLEEPVPAPLPSELSGNTNSAARWAFSLYGNKAEVGVFGTDCIPVADGVLRSHSLLHIAVAMRDVAKIEKLVEAGFDLNRLAGDGLAPLHWSIAPDTTESLIKLLQSGADPNVKSTQGATPIMNAVQSDKIEFLQLLLDAGASVNAIDKRGFTALHRAAEMGYETIVELLLKRGADKSIEAESHTALSLAQARDNKSIIELLSDTNMN